MATSVSVKIADVDPTPEVIAIARFAGGTIELTKYGQWRPKTKSESDRRFMFIMRDKDVSQFYSLGLGWPERAYQRLATDLANRVGFDIELVPLPPRKPTPFDKRLLDVIS